MRGAWGPRTLAFVAYVAASPLAAQNMDCAEPITQLDMNQCAYAAWQEADAQLNDAYRLAIAKARRIDSFDPALPRRAGGPETDGVSTEEMLRRAQRAWITFRDAACLVDSDIARGGSMQPLLFSSCAASLTRTRTEQLRSFGEFD
ncbi:MAG: lysozyme inhibitor LprI family protein [Pseudomonadota bacterium]